VNVTRRSPSSVNATTHHPTIGAPQLQCLTQPPARCDLGDRVSAFNVRPSLAPCLTTLACPAALQCSRAKFRKSLELSSQTRDSFERTTRHGSVVSFQAEHAHTEDADAKLHKWLCNAKLCVGAQGVARVRAHAQRGMHAWVNKIRLINEKQLKFQVRKCDERPGCASWLRKREVAAPHVRRFRFRVVDRLDGKWSRWRVQHEGPLRAAHSTHHSPFLLAQ
jgi:hypothetical protein